MKYLSQSTNIQHSKSLVINRDDIEVKSPGRRDNA
jgi:hypothetical protein